MIDLTPLDVRQKRGDFRKALRGYDAEEVDGFLELVAERLEDLVKENLTLRERTERLGRQVEGQEGRERAVQEALVTAQELRDEIREQAKREADVFRREAEAEIEDRMREAQSHLDDARRAIESIERRRSRFLKRFRALLESELDALEVEEARPSEDAEPVDLDLGEWRPRVRERMAASRRPAAGPAEDAEAGGGAADAGAGSGAGEGGGDAPDGPGSPDEPLWLSSLLEESASSPAVQEGGGVEDGPLEEAAGEPAEPDAGPGGEPTRGEARGEEGA